MEKLSKEACLKIADVSREIIKKTLRNGTFDVNIYEAPEVYDARIDGVVASIVNYALNVAHEEWNKASADTCAYCLEYEHGMKPVDAVVCTCQHHCGAMVCPAGDAFVCRHPTYVIVL